ELARARGSASQAPRSRRATRRRVRARRLARPATRLPSRRATFRARTGAESRPRSLATTRAAVPTFARRAEMRAGARLSSSERDRQLELGGDRGKLAEPLLEVLHDHQ